MLLLHPLPTCADAGPDLCTLHPDLCTLRLWCYPSINQCKYSIHLHTWWWSLAATSTGGIFPSAMGTNTPCTAGGVTHCNLRWWSFSFHPLAHILHLHSSNLHYVVEVCRGGKEYIYIPVYFPLHSGGHHK